MGGDCKQESHVGVFFPVGLSKGVYVALFKADWESHHTERKLVFAASCA